MIEQIRNKETPVTDINSLSSWVNTLVLATGVDRCKLKKIKGEWSLNSVTEITSRTGNEVRLILKSERKIRISTKDPDVSSFTKCELKEILAALNCIAKGDHALDRVRRAILERLNLN